MNLDSYQTILWIVVVWPLLLAIPAVHSRLPWPRHLALLPPLILLLFAGNVSLELPWLLFGTGLAIDSNSRWILAMTLFIWLMSASLDKASKHGPGYNRANTFFLITLGGNLGTLLSTELVGFFCFSTIMGYGFYGLLMEGGDAKLRRAGRIYLIFLVLADLALFEALLLAAYSTDNLHYLSVHQAMAGSGSSQFYFWMAFVGFAFKAGIWPVHLWLSAAFSSAPVSRSLLLGGVPVAMALLGAIHWLPLGENVFHLTGSIIQGLGVASILYAALRIFSHIPMKQLPAWAGAALTGLFISALGTGLAYPAVWQQYGYISYPFIAALGVLLALLVVLSFKLEHLLDTRQQADIAILRIEALGLYLDRWICLIVQWISQRLLRFKSRLRASYLQTVKQSQHIMLKLQPKIFITGWNTKITLFALLGLAVAWLAG